MGGGTVRLPPAASIAALFRAPAGNSTVTSLKKGTARNTAAPLILDGWVHRKPKKFNKNLTFAYIRDVKGEIIQVVDRSNSSVLKSLKPDSTVTVELARNGDDFECQNLYVRGQADLIPGELQAEKTKEWPAKFRYVQLRQPQFQRALRARAAITKICRSVLDGEQFTEIETPILFKSTPEGAREFLVPTRRRGFTYALPQSPQQYKQLLIASGIDKYYQIARCFRDEDLRADRQPEFTQLDLEMAFARPEDVQSVVEKVVAAAWQSVDRELISARNSDAQKGFAKLEYSECIAKYGIDKPDLRSDLEIVRLNGATAKSNTEFPVFEFMPVSQKLLDNLSTHDKTIPRVRYVKYKDEEQLKKEVQHLAHFENSEWPQLFRSITEGLDASNTVLAFGDRQELSYENPTPLGRLRQLLASVQAEQSSDTKQPSVAAWVEKFPSFEPLEVGFTESGYPIYDRSQLKATHHPFTMVALEDYKFLESGEPLKCHGMHFDLVIDGVEVGGGSQRIHSSDLQRYILKEVVGVENPDHLFGHLLEALGTGCPPHAGLAIGMDRMVAMLLGYSSIRDVIAFPKNNSGADPVVGSPSRATPNQLAEYNLKLSSADSK